MSTLDHTLFFDCLNQRPIFQIHKKQPSRFADLSRNPTAPGRVFGELSGDVQTEFLEDPPNSLLMYRLQPAGGGTAETDHFTRRLRSRLAVRLHPAFSHDSETVDMILLTISKSECMIHY
jgi:hypothetical protein